MKEKLTLDKLIQMSNDYMYCCYDNTNLQHGSPQHKELVRTFFAGVVCMLSYQGEDGGIEDLVTEEARKEMMLMATKEWEPDDRYTIHKISFPLKDILGITDLN